MVKRLTCLKRSRVLALLFTILPLGASFTHAESSADARLEVLFLGDNGHHAPAQRAQQLIPAMLDRDIFITYTEDVERSLTPETLDRYDALLLYANIESISPSQADALLDYVAEGGGFVPVHSASYCFQNDPRIVALIGGQFARHGTGVFQTRIAEPNHPVMRGLDPIESWDETYEHTRHNEENRTVLAYREEEPYTWVRTHGDGRVFYTAWGHDERTFSNSDFHDLIERGIRWSAGQDVQKAISERTIDRPFEYVEERIVYYPPGERSRGDGDWNEMQKPLSPEESMERIIVPGGFELQLFASDPDIRKPITMAWDEQGRLWIAETVDYPNRLQPVGEGRDRLTILEDTDNDGKADKSTVFADNLSIPTGIAFANGGVIIYQPPHTLFLKDTDGDDKADVKETIFSGWGTGDTHAMASNLRYGLDNWYWGSQGYSGFNGEVAGERHRFGSGFHRFRADGSALEFMRSTNNNTWGLGFGEDGLVFGSTANNVPSVFMPFSNSRYEGIDGLDAYTLPSIANTSRFLPVTPKVRQVDVHGGYTAGAGHALYTARAWPQEYWNRIAFVTEPTGHLVGEFVLTPDGADFTAKNPTNIIVSDDEWFAPVMAEVGPDGHLWVIDWYNYIIQHNPTPAYHENGDGNAYETDLRDKRHGRIYRVVYTGAEPYEPISLENAGPEKLIATLQHDNMLWRQHAQRLLVERGELDVVPALTDLIRNEEVDAIGLNVGAIHALWTLHGLGALDGSNAAALAAATSALEHPSAGVRRNAAQVLPANSQTEQAILAADLLEDEDAQVRLAAILALSEVPASRTVGEAIFAISDEAENADRVLQDALIIAAARHQDGFMAAANASGALVKAMEEPSGPNLLPNASFEEVENGQPIGWTVRTYAGEAEHLLADEARTGNHALLISSTEGADSSFWAAADVKPDTRYKLSGWVKTEDVEGAVGGLYNLNSFSREAGATPGVDGSEDWRQVELTFESGNRETLSVNALFGGWGRSTGSVWYDDVSLIELGPVVTGDRVLRFIADRADGQVPGATEVPAGFENATVVNLGVVPDVMRFDQEELTLPAGEKVKLVFTNPDHMPHNFVLVASGALEKVGALADQMLSDPEAVAKNYVPESPDVLASTPVINPGETFELYFTVPSEPGTYPFVCTFPGHWRIMQGVLIVE